MHVYTYSSSPSSYFLFTIHILSNDSIQPVSKLDPIYWIHFLKKTFYLSTKFPFLYLGGLYLVSCGSNITRLPVNANTNGGNVVHPREIAVNGSSISTGNKLQSLCDFSSLAQFKQLHITKLSANENVISPTSPSAPKWDH